MMESTEKYGMDVDEAVRLALDEMGLNEDQVIVTVLEEPTKGFLGLGSKLARVKVERIPDDFGAAADISQAEAMAQAGRSQATKANHDFRKKNRPQQGQQAGGGQGGRPAPRQDRGGRGPGGDGRGPGRDSRDGGRPPRRDYDQGRGEGRERGPRDHDGERAPRDYDGERGPREHGQGRGPRDYDRGERTDRGGRGGRDDRRGQDNRGPRRSEKPAQRPPRSEEPFADFEIDIASLPHISGPIENLVAEPGSKAAAFLDDVLKKMNLDVSVEGMMNDECRCVEVKGEDARMVIGKRGQTLDALQYLTNLVSNKDAEEYKRVIIDVEGYRSRREKTLEELAVKLAKKVMKTGRPARLEPMNPYERKVIHATLQHIDGVTTVSEGEEPYRRVIIERG